MSMLTATPMYIPRLLHIYRTATPCLPRNYGSSTPRLFMSIPFVSPVSMLRLSHVESPTRVHAQVVPCSFNFNSNTDAATQPGILKQLLKNKTRSTFASPGMVTKDSNMSTSANFGMQHMATMNSTADVLAIPDQTQCKLAMSSLC